jgi:hypothetical protein
LQQATAAICQHVEHVELVSVLALLLYSLQLLSLPLQLRALPVNLLLLLLLHLLVALELVSNQSTTSRSERTTDERPRNRMVNGTTDKTPRSGSSQRSDSSPFLRSVQTRAAQKCHYEWQGYKSSEYASHRFSFSFEVPSTYPIFMPLDE